MKTQLRFTFFLLSLIVASVFTIGCKKETETVIVTETVIERDTLTFVNTIREVIIQTDTLTVVDTLEIVNTIRDTATTFIVLRHAEKVSSGGDPVLSSAGQARANSLNALLSQVNLDAIYSTNFNRTKLTVQPTATSKMLSISIYNPFSLSPFVDNVLNSHHDGTVLVVGHSNTTPDLLNVLTGTNFYTIIPESEYDNLYIVTVFEKGRSEVVHFKY